MAKKKKSEAGGQTGRPAFSEPRVQVFSKFNGCNFQLAVRDFDSVFELDQEAQTDLMPMFMAVQNNARIAPMGGIETRHNIVKILEPPLREPGSSTERKSLTGVVTLVGGRLYAACSDDTIHFGDIEDGEVVSMDGKVEPLDLNDTYGESVEYSYEGWVE